MRFAQRTSTWITALLLLGTTTAAQTTRAISVSSAGGGQADGDSGFTGSFLLTLEGCSISNDGRYVLFSSVADNIVPGDTNGDWDIYLRDLLTGGVVRVNVDATGAEAHGPLGQGGSFDPSMSWDDRYIAFASIADNLVPNDTNGTYDVFVKDLQTGSIQRASVGPNGAEANGQSIEPMISGNGRYVVFTSSATNLAPLGGAPGPHIFLRDLQAGMTTVVDVSTSGLVADESTGGAPGVSISSDGRYIAFATTAPGLVPEDTDIYGDLFLRDVQAGTTTRVVQGVFNGVISANGRYLAHDSNSVFPVVGVYDLQTSTDTPASLDENGASVVGQSPAISADGRWITFLHPDTGLFQVFARDLVAGQSVRVSVLPQSATWGDGNSVDDPSGRGVFSGDDRKLLFTSYADNLVASDTNGASDVFVRDLQAGESTRLSLSGPGFPANGGSYAPSLSADGRYVAFESTAPDIVSGDTNGKMDVFVRDSQAGTIVRASVASNGAQGDQDSDSPSISSDGRYVAFDSEAANLVPGDTNGQEDVFVRDLQLGTTELVSVSSSGIQGNESCAAPSISADGRYVAFFGLASNLVSGDTNNTGDVFVHDRSTGITERVSVDSFGNQGNAASSFPAISADGRYVAFSSNASNLVPNDTNGHTDVFVRDRQIGTTTLVSVGLSGHPGNLASVLPAISADGRFIAFISSASDLVQGDANGSYDVFVRDMVAGTTERVDVASNGAEATGTDFTSDLVAISADGRYVAFDSGAVNLVSGDTNGSPDVFLHDRLTGVTERLSVSSAGVQGDGTSGNLGLGMSADGRFIGFASFSTNLDTGDTNGASDVFLRDRGDGAVFAAFCFGDGTIFACPCGNSGSPGHGCQNSAGTGGAVLTGSGVPSLAADTVHFSSSGELPSVTSLLLQGTAISAATIFGDGRRCAGGTLKRLFSHPAVGGVATAPQGADLSISARSAALGAPISAGSTRIYQMYYRDPSSTFCPNPPGNLYNISSAVAVTWGN